MAETPSELDITHFSESTRRRLYDRIVEIQLAVDGGAYDPDDSGLQVVFFAGRWFATWLDLAEPVWRPLPLRLRIVRVGLGSGRDVELYDV